MSADLETNITLTGTKDELASYIKVLKVFANDNNKRYTTNRDCVYIHWAKLSSKEILLNLDDATDKEITDFLEGCDKTIFVSAAGPYGAYGDFDTVGLFEAMAEAAPTGSFSASINGFVTGADTQCDVELEDGKLYFTESFVDDACRPEFDDEDPDFDEDAYEQEYKEAETTREYTYDPLTKQYEIIKDWH